MPLAPGTLLGPYEILGRIGSGGMGAVYKARDTRLDRIVAIKVAHEEFSGRFEREARAVAALNHPHICTLFDVGPNYLVMEFVDGQPLMRQLSPGEAVRVGIQIADALDTAHRRGIVHRDLKPANIMITPDSQVKILDFGIAAFDETAGREPGDMPTQDLALTNPGSAIGTVAYMSPEQARGEKVDARTDLWSFGVVLYELVTGVRPFPDGTTALTFDGVLNRTPAPVRELVPEISPELESIIVKALEKDRDIRYQTAADMRADLKRLERTSSLTAYSSAVTAPIAAVRPPQPRLGKIIAIIAASVMVVVAAVVFFLQRAQARQLTDQDTIVLADFSNSTGDLLFDGTLREALAVQLEQSPFLKIMDDGPMRRDLQLMGHSATDRITNAAAREICQRENEKATIGGSIASFGRNYAITLEAVNCRTGETLAREQKEADDKEHVLRALSSAATDIRKRLGESLATVQKLDKPLDLVTTTSLEALQSFALGRTQANQGSQIAAVPYFRHATELDPDFAMAWEWMGILYRNAGEMRSAVEYFTKAYGLMGRVSERERLAISGRYHLFVTGELDKAIGDLQLTSQTYPREAQAHNNLGSLYVQQGDFERALPEYEAALRLDPDTSIYSGNLGAMFLLLDRFNDAHRAFEKIPSGKADSSVHLYMMRAAEVEGDAAAERREIEWFSGKPEEYSSLDQQAVNHAALGQIHLAEDLAGQSVRSAEQRNLASAAARTEADTALFEAAADRCDAAHTHATRGAEESPLPVDVYPAALALAFCGYDAEAQKVAERTSQRWPLNTIWNTVYLPTIRAAMAEKKNDPEKALDLLRSPACCDRRYTEPVYIRGLALLDQHRATEAAAEFHKILDHKGANWSIWYSLAYLGLARAEKSPSAYQDFLTIWKDADAGLPAALK